MQPSFKPPKTEEEFKARAKEITVDAAHNMIGILNRRKAIAVKPLDEEIQFYEKVLEYKEKESA